MFSQLYFFPCITNVEPSILHLPLNSSFFLASFNTGLRYWRSFSVSAQYSLSTKMPSRSCFLHCISRSLSSLCSNLIDMGLLLHSLYLPSLSVQRIGILSAISIRSSRVCLLTVWAITPLTFDFQ